MKKEYYLGREYGVLPKCLQFIIFIHQGLFNGGGGKWRWNKIKRIHCWYDRHEYLEKYKYTESGQGIEVVEYVRKRCKRCGFIRDNID